MGFNSGFKGLMNTTHESGLAGTQTHTACRAERRVASKPQNQLPSRLFRRVQRRLLSVENDYFKWHCFMNNNHVSVPHIFFNERNESGEPLLHAVRKHPKSFLEYLKIFTDRHV